LKRGKWGRETSERIHRGEKTRMGEFSLKGQDLLLWGTAQKTLGNVFGPTNKGGGMVTRRRKGGGRSVKKGGKGGENSSAGKKNSLKHRRINDNLYFRFGGGREKKIHWKLGQRRERKGQI